MTEFVYASAWCLNNLSEHVSLAASELRQKYPGQDGLTVDCVVICVLSNGTQEMPIRYTHIESVNREQKNYDILIDERGDELIRLAASSLKTT